MTTEKRIFTDHVYTRTSLFPNTDTPDDISMPICEGTGAGGSF